MVRSNVALRVQVCAAVRRGVLVLRAHICPRFGDAD
jgi:hypothetical protein